MVSLFKTKVAYSAHVAFLLVGLCSVKIVW